MGNEMNQQQPMDPYQQQPMGMDQEGGFTQPPPIEQSPKKTFPQIYQNMKAYKILIITGIALIVLGGTICAVSGITFRPNQTTDYGDDAGQKGEIPVAGNTLGDDHKVQAVFQIKF